MIPDEKTAAICGLFCGTCPNYPAYCHGCLSDRLAPGCDECAAGFRSCAAEHGVKRCHECPQFPCGRLNDFSGKHWQNGICHHATVIEDLRAMKEIGAAAWVIRKTAENTCPDCGKLIRWYERGTHVCKR